MKKLLFFVLVLINVGFAKISDAQSLATFVGFKMGPNWANFEGKSVSTDLKQRVGFGFGIVTDFSIKKANDKDFSRWSLCPEFNLVPGGAVDKSSTNTIKYNLTYKFNYLRVPVLIRFYHGLLGQAKSGLFGEIGPYGGYLLSAKTKGSTETLGVKTNIDNDVKKDFEETDYGVSFGGGVALAGILTINYRYDWGLANISKNDGDFTNRAWGIYLNLMLPIGGK